MLNHITNFFRFLLPILRSAVVQVAADELTRIAYPPRPGDIRRGYTRRPQRTSYSRMSFLRLDDADFQRYSENYEKVHSRTNDFHDVLLVAFDLRGISARDVHDTLTNLMPKADAFYGENEDVYLDSWWVANDERFDGSDTDSAVFVSKGNQEEARILLRKHGLVGL